MLARRVAADTQRSVDDAVFTLQALGGVLHVLTPYVVPGAQAAIDEGVKLLIDAVGPSNDELVAQAAAASLGHIAARSPAWRTPLQACLPDIDRRMKQPGQVEETVKHQKCLMWASAVIAGLPVVLHEMRSQPNAPNLQDAAISAIIDILDEHTDGPDDTSAGEAVWGVDPAHVPGAIETLAGVMRLHRSHVPIQWRGCQALGLLHCSLPSGKDTPVEAIEGVLAALRWHPNEYKVVSGACGALRAFLEPRGGSGAAASTAAVARTVTSLRGRDVIPVLRKVLDDFANSVDKELLEDTLYALGLTGGLLASLEVLAESRSSDWNVRSAGLKALFELGRAFPDLLTPPRTQEILHVAAAIAQDAMAADLEAAKLAAGADPGDMPRGPSGHPGAASEESLELLRRVELVRGMLGS